MKKTKDFEFYSHIENILIKNSLESFIKDISSHGEILFFGGLLRDCLLNNTENLRDLDIVVDAFEPNFLEYYLNKNKYNYIKNKFNGFKIKFDTVEVDIWEIQNTWAIKNNFIKESQKNIINSVYLNIDGIAFNYSTNILYSSNYENAIANREIDIILYENPHVELNLLRALEINKLYNFEFSSNLKNIYKKKINTYGDDFINNLYNIQLSRYKSTFFSKNELSNMLENFY